MSKRPWLFVLSVVIFLALVAAGCSVPDQPSGPGATQSPVATPPAGQRQSAPTPGPGATATKPAARGDQARTLAQQYLKAWEQRDYSAMYSTLSGAAKQTISQEKFSGRYEAITAGATITQVVATINDVSFAPSAANPVSATVSYAAAFRSSRLGNFDEQNSMPLLFDDGQWRVAWTPGLIFQDLIAETFVRLDSDDPVRGSIVDRKGRPLATSGSIVSVGLVPGEIKDETKALQALSDYLGVAKESIKAKYASAKPDWWVPLRDLPSDKRSDAEAKLGGIAGVEVRSKEARVYPQAALAAHLTGYVSQVNADELKKLAAEGYEEGDLIGRDGVEAQFEKDLAGKKGGRLVIVDADGNTVREIARRKSTPGAKVQLTIDLDVQKQADQALTKKVGSVVVIDPRDNSILALVSHPSYDPNAFVAGISDQDWQKLSKDPNHPFLTRPTQSAYPTGSIFKVITMAAGIEKGGYTPQSEFECTPTWTGLPGVVLRDWLPEGHGHLNLVRGLTTSCNIVFYELGKKLDSIDNRILPDFAKAFGLGAPSGLNGLPEVAGIAPDPAWKRKNKGEAWFAGDSVNLAIGQGFLEATPLQMANLYAALANGGTLRAPLLVKSVGEGAGGRQFTAQHRNKLPASPATLAAIREGMKGVTATAEGTAYYAFNGFQIPVAAKTGSAENEDPNAHAWFAGYAPADAPEIVTLVMVEGGQLGGQVAAPIGRQIMEAYFKR